MSSGLKMARTVLVYMAIVCNLLMIVVLLKIAVLLMIAALLSETRCLQTNVVYMCLPTSLISSWPESASACPSVFVRPYLFSLDNNQNGFGLKPFDVE